MTKEQFGTDTPIYNKSFYNSRGQLSEIRVSDSYTGPTDEDYNRGAIINHYSNNCWGKCGGPTDTMPDNNGNLKKQGVYIPSQSDWWQRYDYDNLNRLQRVFENTGNPQTEWQQEYVYDRYGNRTIHQTDTWSPAVGPPIPKPNFGVNTATNQLTPPSGTMSYDPAGNLTNDTYSGTGNRTYDAENRITQAWGGMDQWQFYTYNADGQRVRRKLNGVETWQIYGMDGELLTEYGATDPMISPSKEYGYRNGQLLIVAETWVGSAAAPSGLAAVPSGGGASITLSWSAASGATNYSVERRAAGGSYASAGTTTLTGFIDIGVISGNAYLYKVCAADGSGNCLSPYSNIALGAAVSFPTDPTIISILDDPTGLNVTTAKIEHITELRSAVNAVRTLAGLAAASWTNPTLTRYVSLISADDVRDLRVKLDEALTALGIQTSAYDDHTLAGAPNGTLIRKTHITQLRQRATSGSGGAGGGSSQFNLQWLVADQLGTPRMILDKTGSLGNMKRHDYLPFGEELYAGTGGRTTGQGYVGDNVRQKFTSKERDNETNLDYFLARYYSSPQGRFTSPDEFVGGPDELFYFASDAAENPTFYAELANPQSLNKYQYCLNNPLRYIDPDGHQQQEGKSTNIVDRIIKSVTEILGSLGGSLQRAAGKDGAPQEERGPGPMGNKDQVIQAYMDRVGEATETTTNAMMMFDVTGAGGAIRSFGNQQFRGGSKTDVAISMAAMTLGKGGGGPIKIGFGEAKSLVGAWAKDPVKETIASSIKYHFGKHGSRRGQRLAVFKKSRRVRPKPARRTGDRAGERRQTLREE